MRSLTCAAWMHVHQAWRLTNDLLVEPGGRPWIAEMYGFSFGAASAGVAFHWNRTAMIYPRDYPEGVPDGSKRTSWDSLSLPEPRCRWRHC